MPRNTEDLNARPHWQNILPGDLAFLIRSVELGSFSAVAREHNLPTSSVSRAIQRLETTWGVRLLRRSTHALSLTPEGEVAVDLGRQSLATLAEIGERLAAPQQQVSGSVRLAVSAAVARYVVVPALPLLLARYPQLQLELLIDDRANDFTQEGVDLAVRTGVISDESLIARPIGSFRRGLFAARTYLQQYGQPKTPADLAGHRFVSHQRAPRLNLLRFAAGAGGGEYAVNGHFRASSTDTLAEMIWHGLGIGYMSELIMRSGLASGQLVELLPDFTDPVRHPIYAVYQADRLRPQRIVVVLEFLKEIFGPEQTGAGLPER